MFSFSKQVINFRAQIMVCYRFLNSLLCVLLTINLKNY